MKEWEKVSSKNDEVKFKMNDRWMNQIPIFVRCDKSVWSLLEFSKTRFYCQFPLHPNRDCFWASFGTRPWNHSCNYFCWSCPRKASMKAEKQVDHPHRCLPVRVCSSWKACPCLWTEKHPLCLKSCQFYCNGGRSPLNCRMLVDFASLAKTSC